MNWLLVFLGGGAGAVCRYGLARLVVPGSFADGHFPWATFLANFVACILLGGGLALALRQQLPTEGQLLLLTGFCGGLSTFSTFAGEALQLVQAGYPVQAFFYVLVSVLSGCLAIWLLLWFLSGESVSS